MSEIKDMYDRHPSIKSIKSMSSITVITTRVVSIDFYRLIDTIDNDQVIDIDSYRFTDRFSDIDFYRLPTSGNHELSSIVLCNNYNYSTRARWISNDR